MIDWVTAIIPCDGAGRIVGGKLIRLSADGEIEWETNCRVTVEGSYSASVQIKADGDSLLWVSGNPSKFLQGHNLFGSNNPRKLIYVFLDELTRRLKLTPTLGDRLRWRSGYYKLLTIDIAECFRLPSTKDVDNWIRAAAPLVRGKHQQVSAYGGETIYIGQRSRRIALKIYNKAREIKKHKLPAQIPFRDKLHVYAEGLLRVEVRILSQELKRRELDFIENWDANTAKEILKERIGRLEMPQKMRLTDSEIRALPPRLAAAAKLWESGEDIRSIYTRATFYRYRTELRKYGIDILAPPKTPTNVVPLVSYLEAKHQANVPDWAIGTPLIACAG